MRHGRAGRHFVVATESEMKVVMKIMAAIELIYTPSVSFPKLAILCLYLRIFTTKFYRYSTYICAGIILISNVVFFVLALTDCTPLASKWDRSIQGHCIYRIALYRYVSLPNLLTDFLMLGLPLPVIWRLHTGRSQKIGLTITFLTGSM